jgi:hypothetical protein
MLLFAIILMPLFSFRHYATLSPLLFHFRHFHYAHYCHDARSRQRYEANSHGMPH